MKANKIFAVVLTALTFVGFNACKPQQQAEALKLDPTSITLKVGETATITANVAATWASNKEAVATVVPGNDGGKTAIVTAVAEGNAIISATANGETKTCVILVEKAVDPSGDKTIDAKRIWPVILDAVTAEKYASLIAGDVRVNEAEGIVLLDLGDNDLLLNVDDEFGEEIITVDGDTPVEIEEPAA
jgi:hypothetical protein